MSFTPQRATANTRIQIGAESTSALGTSVAAGKLLEALDFQFGIEADVQLFRATGRKYDGEQIENSEWMGGTVSGMLDYNALQYLLASAMGSSAPVAHGASTTAKDWIYTPPVSGVLVPQTYTVEQGDSVRAHKTSYVLVKDFGYKLTRQSATVNGTTMSFPIADGITMTATPTVVALSPIAAKHFNVYIDPTYGALGTTQLLKVLSVDYSFGGIYGPFFPINRANIGFTTHVDLTPTTKVKIKMEADSVGMAYLSGLQAGTTYFLRVEAIGAEIDVPNTTYNTFRHDMAIKFGKPSTFADASGVFALEWECTIVEDGGWGMAQQATVTNLITAL